jgi:hypothetical protein
LVFCSVDISSTLQEPTAFRILLIYAGLHYTWNAGALFSYDATVLFHKVESMRIVNEWLADSIARTAGKCARTIATLCLTEASTLPYAR